MFALLCSLLRMRLIFNSKMSFWKVCVSKDGKVRCFCLEDRKLTTALAAARNERRLNAVTPPVPVCSWRSKHKHLTMDSSTPLTIPQWLIDAHEYRQRVFLRVVEPIICALLGPVEEEHTAFTAASYKEESDHRRLGFLPNYIEDVSSFHETSMSFATLCMLFVIMSSTMLIFVSCFYHNQKTSPLFISPRRHRLPKLVPPPLPVDGAFSWVRVCFFLSDEEVTSTIVQFSPCFCHDYTHFILLT